MEKHNLGDLIKPIDLNDYENVDHAIEKPIRELEQKYREAVKALIKINKSVVEHRTEDGYQDVILVMEGIEIENMLERQTGKSWEELIEIGVE